MAANYAWTTMYTTPVIIFNLAEHEHLARGGNDWTLKSIIDRWVPFEKIQLYGNSLNASTLNAKGCVKIGCLFHTMHYSRTHQSSPNSSQLAQLDVNHSQTYPNRSRRLPILGDSRRWEGMIVWESRGCCIFFLLSSPLFALSGSFYLVTVSLVDAIKRKQAIRSFMAPQNKHHLGGKCALAIKWFWAAANTGGIDMTGADCHLVRLIHRANKLSRIQLAAG